MESPVGEVDAQLASVRVWISLDGVQARNAIESALDRARFLVLTSGARSYEPLILIERARFAGLLGDSEARERWLREAHHLFREMGATGHAERTAELLAS